VREHRIAMTFDWSRMIAGFWIAGLGDACRWLA
jgi:hypothetical protein